MISTGECGLGFSGTVGGAMCIIVGFGFGFGSGGKAGTLGMTS